MLLFNTDATYIKAFFYFYVCVRTEPTTSAMNSALTMLTYAMLMGVKKYTLMHAESTA